jgi:hypothetical protein
MLSFASHSSIGFALSIFGLCVRHPRTTRIQSSPLGEAAAGSLRQSYDALLRRMVKAAWHRCALANKRLEQAASAALRRLLRRSVGSCHTAKSSNLVEERPYSDS